MIALCELCGEPMPEGEEMFKYHGYSGPCPISHPKGDSEEAAFRASMRKPEEVWCSMCHKPIIEYIQGKRHEDGSELCVSKEIDALIKRESGLKRSDGGGSKFMKCKECGKDAEDLSKQLLKRRDGTEQLFCGQACRSKYEADAEEFYRWHKK